MPPDVQDFVHFIYDRFGYDFRKYRPATLTSRLHNICARLHLPGIPALGDWLVQNPDQIRFFVDQLCIPVTELFREPETFAEVCAHVFPTLHSFPRITIWHAGCAAGHEAYSMAILLHEAGLLDRSTIFASDISYAVLEKAAQGRIPRDQVQAAQTRYLQGGGADLLDAHFDAVGPLMQLKPELLSKINFIEHSLSTDAVFCEANLIFCCNVLIYFERQLQGRALGLFSDSLVRGGYLCLGQRETPIGARTKFAKPPGASWVYRSISRPRPQLAGAEALATHPPCQAAPPRQDDGS
ncbi:CheR family methyltransferase [Paracoccus shanxieyensis]|uniref:Protein-glutamate O-methyltransferase CheR n=1 Tax=Paracoccus shanxieyensis TaxID=2675752 RepID=A0A6L6J044_9RHOB|nr:protein-glutamate O-methyltransferase CheR [Paracoccus shanxieyensis]MTH64027.1 protein-glutamate O-methyltransferase CheR [Paracoccus shanxieyensis]MTH86932.1 protein-glutamate O-methyltransferase CheR [Paracoccus shanxieyensis]